MCQHSSSCFPFSPSWSSVWKFLEWSCSSWLWYPYGGDLANGCLYTKNPGLWRNKHQVSEAALSAMHCQLELDHSRKCFQWNLQKKGGGGQNKWTFLHWQTATLMDDHPFTSVYPDILLQPFALVENQVLGHHGTLSAWPLCETLAVVCWSLPQTKGYGVSKSLFLSSH